MGKKYKISSDEIEDYLKGKHDPILKEKVEKWLVESGYTKDSTSLLYKLWEKTENASTKEATNRAFSLFKSRIGIKQISPFRVHPNKRKDKYTFPYRCLYSRNIDNLFMAGRNISVSHIALGTMRVQRTTGMMGEVVGLASYLCIKNNCSPRQVYQKHLKNLFNIIL